MGSLYLLRDILLENWMLVTALVMSVIMSRFVYCKKKPVVCESGVRLCYGQELKLVMKDGDHRVVTILKARSKGAQVREQFHGEYWLDWDDVMIVHGADDLYTSSQLKQAGLQWEQRLS